MKEGTEGFIPEQKQEGQNCDLTTRADLTHVEIPFDELSHEELVRKFRSFVRQREQQTGGYWKPEQIIRSKLNLEAGATHLSEAASPAEQKEAQEFFCTLQYAWDALVYDRYEPGSSDEHLAGVSLSMYYHHLHEPVIKLTHPAQIRAIDALTEVFEIPHTKGQAEIVIPENLRHYDQWTASREYQDRVARATSKGR